MKEGKSGGERWEKEMEEGQKWKRDRDEEVEKEKK